MTVSKKIDSYINAYADSNPIWIVKLSNGETVYQDDGRPDVKPESAWLRLKQYCEENNLYITNMKLKNRSNQVDLGSDHDGYFFCKVAGSFMFSGDTNHSFKIGYLNDGRLRVRKWNLPAILPEAFEDRDLKGSGEMLIYKKGSLNGEEL
tara:strand:+ start:16480 stop:16929 length:450 start_codon:yes stop_codon:yes gene_type:complete